MRDGSTGLPDRARLVADMQHLCTLDSGKQRTMALLEVAGYERMLQAFRAVGLEPMQAMMRNFAARLVELVGGRATVYRTSDLHFAFMLEGDSVEEHAAFAAWLAEQTREPLRGEGAMDLDLAPQLGLAVFKLTREGVGDVLRQVASALHEARIDERPFGWFSQGRDTRSRRAFTLLQEVPRGLAEGEFRLVYQPKLNLRTRQYSGVEALIRWNHPRLGALSPAEFIPLVENSRLIHLLTEWVLHTALAQLGVWQREGIALSMAVNVSARNLEHPDFMRILRNACAVHGVAPRDLHIECTENAALTGQKTLAVLHQVRALGVQVSLDDFGVGYCNFACLHSLPAELLKLDQSLIRPIATDARAWELLKSIIALGHALGYRLLAEGVETPEIFDMLELSGCDAVQGYYLARPLEAADLVVFLKRHLELFTLAA